MNQYWFDVFDSIRILINVGFGISLVVAGFGSIIVMIGIGDHDISVKNGVKALIIMWGSALLLTILWIVSPSSEVLRSWLI